MQRYHWFWVIWVPLLLIGLMLSGCQSNSTPSASTNKAQETVPEEFPSTIGLGTFPTGGSSYMVATGVAKVLSDRSPIKVIVKPSAGPVAFNPLLESGELGLGIESGNDIAWSYNSGPGYEKPYKNMRVLVSGHGNPTVTLSVRLDSGISSIKELKGKRVAGGYGGFVVGKQCVTATLESVGLTWNDVKEIPVADPSSAVRALQERRVDAAFGGQPIGSLNLEIDSATPLHALNFGDLPAEQADNPPIELVEVLRKYVPGASIYRQHKEGFLKSDSTAINFVSWLAASSKLSADAAYEITKSVYENDKELQPLHDLLKEWRQETMFDSEQPAPYHEGAVRFWKEKGLWTPEAEENQKRLLGQ